jgi:hypothetical protein
MVLRAGMVDLSLRERLPLAEREVYGGAATRVAGAYYSNNTAGPYPFSGTL